MSEKRTAHPPLATAHCKSGNRARAILLEQADPRFLQILDGSDQLFEYAQVLVDEMGLSDTWTVVAVVIHWEAFGE